MPFLREAPDDTLADTLGNLGASLGQALNPLNRLRAQETVQQIQQQRFELQRQQAVDAANANAATVYERANPHGLNDADLAATVAGIRNGTYNPAQTIDALKAAGGYAANSAAADMVDAAHPEWSSSQRASAKADILSGRKNLSEVETDFANAGITTNKATTTLDATGAARTSANSTNAPANAALAAEAAASGDTAGAAKIIAQSHVLDQGAALPQDTPVNAPALTTLSTEQGIAGVPQTPPAQTAGPRAVADITGKTIVAQAAARPPNLIVPRVAPVDPLTGQPVVVAPGATPPPSVFSQPAQGPDTKATAASAAAEASSKAINDFAASQLQDGVTGLTAAQKVQNGVAQMRRLGAVIANAGPGAQVSNALAKELYDRWGITATAGQSAREVFDNYVAALMADWRKDEGVQRLALPEIQLGQRSLPSGAMDQDALNQALDAVQAKAQLGEKAGRAALKYWTRKDHTMAENASDYLTERAQIYDPANDPTQSIRTTRENAPPPAPPVRPVLKAGPNGTWLHLQPDGSYR